MTNEAFKIVPVKAPAAADNVGLPDRQAPGA